MGHARILTKPICALRKYTTRESDDKFLNDITSSAPNTTTTTVVGGRGKQKTYSSGINNTENLRSIAVPSCMLSDGVSAPLVSPTTKNLFVWFSPVWESPTSSRSRSKIWHGRRMPSLTKANLNGTKC